MSPCYLFNFTPQTHAITNDSVYADENTMTAMEDERPSRKLRSESRLYNFLTRSRSRSRSKHDSIMTPTALPPSPPASKPVSRLPSRPLSSTTITPKPRKQYPKLPPLPDPKPSGTRQKLHDLFGIPLRRGSRSRPSSPRTSLDIPPDELTPRPRRSLAPSISRPRSPSPTPGPKVLRVTNATTTSSSTGSTAASIKISKFFTKSSTPSNPDPIHTPKPSSGPPTLPPLPSFVSAPLRPSSSHRRSLKDPAMDPQSSPVPPLPPPPKITHTPPTPLKNNPSNGNKSTLPTSSRHVPKASLDSAYRHRKMSVLDEEGATQKSKFTDILPSHQKPIPRAPPIKMTTSVRSTKHGSFDFERPGWGPSIIQRTGSSGTTESGVSKNESVYGPGLAGVGTVQREASMRRGQEQEVLRTNGLARKTADREKDSRSVSQRTTPQHSSTDQGHNSTSTAGTGPSAAGKSSSMSKATGRRHNGMKTASGSGISRLIGGLTTQHGAFSFERPVPSSTWSTGTATSTGTAGEATASWTGRKAERERERVREEKERQRELRRRSGTQRGGDRAPVPVPSVLPTTTTGFKPSHGGSGSNVGYRSGTKGRSLDLGLGLAWAPTKVREDALLPSSTFFARSMSGSSSATGRTASGSTTGRSGGSVSGSTNTGHHSNGRSRGREEAERTKLGKEVAGMFRNALDPEGFTLFRTYAHQFDANQIPFDGPTGIVSLVENLLASAPHLGDQGKHRLLDKFVRVILQQA